MKRIAIPLKDTKLSPHFGHCEFFGIYEVEEGEIKDIKHLAPPAHQPGVYPRWLASLRVTDIIAGGMGQKAKDLFESNGINTHIGVPDWQPEELAKALDEGILPTGDNTCDHT
ncbi:MAG: ATPase [Candidatus Neomarinimicrobiota bacterium]|nr:ATPase [Candidatus Neomarinimicrobiota bacterium]RKY46706.1 MAG: ATPase [Candidatus Neomarinimicrobiota bacterium]